MDSKPYPVTHDILQGFYICILHIEETRVPLVGSDNVQRYFWFPHAYLLQSHKHLHNFTKVTASFEINNNFHVALL